MSCQSTSFAKAAGPVGQPLVAGSPNQWNLAGGNYYSKQNEFFLPDPQPTNQVGGKKYKRRPRKHKTRKHKKSKRRNIKHKKKTHKRKHKKQHKKKYSRKHKKTHRRKHKKHTKRRKMRGGGRMPLLMPQSLVNLGRGIEGGIGNLIDGWQGRSLANSSFPTQDQFRGQDVKIIPAKPVDVRAIYNAAGQAAGSI